MGGFTEVSLAGAEAAGEAAAGVGGGGLLEQIGSGLTSAVSGIASGADGASGLAPNLLDGIGDAAANAGGAATSSEGLLGGFGATADIGAAPPLTTNLLDRAGPDATSEIGDMGMAAPFRQSLTDMNDGSGGDGPLTLASGIADQPSSIGSGRDVAAPKNLFGGMEANSGTSDTRAVASRIMPGDDPLGDAALERFAKLRRSDDAIRADPEFQVPKIPDKVWEQADQIRAAKEAQAAQAPQADWWQARNMADTVDGRSNFDDVAKHYATQAQYDSHGTRAEIEAVTQELRNRNSASADGFQASMEQQGLIPQPKAQGRSYSESELLGTWRDNVEQQTGQPLTQVADIRNSASSKDQSAPPDNKADFFKSRNPPGTWDDFRGKVQSLPDTSQTGKFALVEVFGQEGGVPKDSSSTASAGILQKTLDNAKDAGVPGLEKATTPSGLTNEQRAAVMRYKLDQEELSHVGGIKALDKIGDDQAAAALADTLYRHGGVEGPKLLQRAINDVEPGAVPKTGFMGNQTLEAYGRLASSPETKGKLLDELAKQRQLTVRDPNEWARFNYYRYLGRR